MLRLLSCETDEALQGQLTALLAPVLLKAASPHQGSRNKVLQILSHVNEVC